MKLKSNHSIAFRSLVLILMLGLIFSSVSYADINGSGNVITKLVEVSNFNKLDIIGAPEVHIIKGTPETLRIEAEDNILPIIEAKVVNGTLKIGFKPSSFKANKTIKYFIIMQDLQQIDATGGVNIISGGHFKSDTLNLTFRGGIVANLHNVNINELKATLNGLAKVTLDGRADNQNIDVAGRGLFDGKALTGKTANVRVSSEGIVKVNASDNLYASINGDSQVIYYGKPKIDQNIAGPGKITAGE